MADQAERLRAIQAFAWSAHVLGWGEIRHAAPDEDAAFKAGLAGQPPPCRCVAAMLAEAERRDALERDTEAWPFALMHEEVAVTLRNLVACLTAHADAGTDSHPVGSCEIGVTEGQDGA